MASIVISDLTGYDLFADQETFLSDLTDSDLIAPRGGITPATTTVTYASVLAFAAILSLM